MEIIGYQPSGPEDGVINNHPFKVPTQSPNMHPAYNS